MNELAKSEPRTELSVADMMGAIVQKEITSDTVAVMKELAQLKRDMDADAAKVAFNRAFAALKKECGPIAATKVIPGKNGEIRSTYAPLEEIMEQVTPLLEKYGFSDTYSQRKIDGGLTEVTATLIHDNGHERSSSFTCREQASPGNTGAQNDSGTTKLAQRKAICMLLGIRFDYTADARDVGGTISKETADDLYRRVSAVCNGDDAAMARYLKLADAGSFHEIKQAKYEVLIQVVEAKERAK